MKKSITLFSLALILALSAFHPLPKSDTEKYFHTTRNQEIISLELLPSNKFVLRLEKWDDDKEKNITQASYIGKWKKEQNGNLKLTCENGAVINYIYRAPKNTLFSSKTPMLQEDYLWLNSTAETFADDCDLINEKQVQRFLQNQIRPSNISNPDTQAASKKDWRLQFVIDKK